MKSSSSSDLNAARVDTVSKTVNLVIRIIILAVTRIIYPVLHKLLELLHLFLLPNNCTLSIFFLIHFTRTLRLFPLFIGQ